MNKRIVFISLPIIIGMTPESIRQNIANAQKAYLSIAEMDSDSVLFLNNYEYTKSIIPFHQIKEGREQIWFLGKVLEALSKCDEVLFWRGWQYSDECRIVHDVCASYGVPMTIVERVTIN